MDPPEVQMDSLEQIQMSVEDCVMIVDGNERTGVTQENGKEIFTNMNIGFIPIYLKSIMTDAPSSFRFIPDCDLEEYRDAWGDDEVFLAGSELDGQKQIVLSEYMLTCFGYTADIQPTLIGKTVSLGIRYEEQQYICLKDYTLQGILKTEYFGMSNSGSLTPQMWIAYDENEASLSHRYDIGGVVNHGFAVYAYLDDFSHISELNNSCETAGFLTEPNTTQLIAIWLSDGMLLLKKIILFLIAFFICIMLISICNSLYFYYSAQKENYNMLMRIGAQTDAIQKICIYELAVIMTRAFLWSVLISAAEFKLISYASRQFLLVEIIFTGDDYLTAILTGGILLTILFALLYWIFPRQILHHADL